jgi:MYXO-CTERM domain-containing protein
VYGNIRLNIVVLDRESRLPVPHVDLEAEVVKTSVHPQLPASGLVFASSTLHEYDGVFEVVFGTPNAGEYRLSAVVSRGQWKQSIHLPFTITGPGVPASGGPGIVSVAGLDGAMAWKRTGVELAVRTLAGTPVEHSEVDFQVMRGGVDGPIVLQNKLHTHGDGNLGFDVALTEPGRYTLRLDPETLEGEPVTSWHIGSLTGGLVMAFDVAPGQAPMVSMVDDGAGVPDASAAAPGVGVLVIAALAAAVALRRRRQA